MKILKFAAIDIGSNAIRLLFSNVVENGSGRPSFRKIDLIRVPIRLGDDAFSDQKISKNKEKALITAMNAFKSLMEVHDVIGYKACATSAMREAKNGKDIIKKIKKATDIDIKIIDGKEEAQIIFATHIAEQIHKHSTYLYIDVGGGSTELSLFARRKCVASKSFDIGTLRLLKDTVQEKEWKALKNWVSQKTKPYRSSLAAIGSGGNINKLYKMAMKKKWEPLGKKKLENLYEQLNTYTYEERVTQLHLNEDRADVIIPAAEIFLEIMNYSEIKKIYVPKIGVADGLIHELYREHKNKK